ncbi:MAG: PepSY-associated TM helix domain-containing protein [Rhodospirillaceae bacterium]|jgi:uncharacterized iron-regulated membrane protein|nr:PepSY-associated TM helix domain-containing protein [Rhodospirillaceae bacterium]
MSPTARNIWVVTHRWTGIIFGLVVVLIGVTGSLLVFEDDLDIFLNPGLYRVEVTGTPLPYDALIEAAAAAGPRNLTPGYFSRIDDAPDRPVVVTLQGRGTTEIQVFVNPYTAEILGTRGGFSSLALIRRLHGDLALGDLGEDLIGVLSIVISLMCLMGLVLWWPNKGAWLRSLKINFRARPRLMLRDLHNAGGAYLFIFMLLSAVTVPPIVWKLTTPGAGQGQAGPPQAVAPPAAGSARPTGLGITPPPNIPWQTAINAAQLAVPDQWVGFTLRPLGPAPFYMVRLFPPGETGTPQMTTVFVNRHNGDIIRISSPAAMTPTRLISADFVITLHSGAIAGLIGRIIMFVAGLGFAVLFVSGIATWWMRLTSRRKGNEEVTET